jgi:uncharacterized protein (DUF433 family)
VNKIQNTPELGQGIYTVPDIAHILNLPQRRIRWYINEIWDNRFGDRIFGERYSWTYRGHKAINFYVLIEFYTVLQLKKLGLNTRTIHNAHESIARDLQVAYPFASSKLLTDGKNILYRFEDNIVNADGTKQTNFESIIEEFCKKIEFDENNLAARFHPMGKASSIVVDPSHQFGQPVIEGTNIQSRVLARMNKGGESVKSLSILYDLTQKQVRDAIAFHKKAA